MASFSSIKYDPLTGLITGDRTAILTALAELGTVTVASLPTGAPSTLTFGSELSPDCDDGLYRKVLMTGDATLNPPSNGADGVRWKARFTASGADRDLTFHASIVLPDAFTLPAATRTIASGKMWIVQLEHNGTAWMLQGLQGGY